MNLLIVNDEQLTAETMKKDMDWASYGISEVYTAYDTEAARVHFSHLPCEVCLCSGGDHPGLSGLYSDPGAVRGYRRKDPQSRGSNPGKKRYCPV